MNSEYMLGKGVLKKIISVINSMNGDYIVNVKYVIFFICKILYTCKVTGTDLHKNDLRDILSKYVSAYDNMGIFLSYDSFDLCQDHVESQVFDLLCSTDGCLDYEEFIPAKLYEMLLTTREKKLLGQVYTPENIIQEMLDRLFEVIPIHMDIKILDPSCGGGYFLIECFRRIKNSPFFQASGLNEKFILEHMLYGVDIDEFSIFLTKMGLLFTGSFPDAVLNIVCSDFLVDFRTNFTFDAVIGNPPYIGHKQTDKEYRKILKEKYNDVFYDKADISYCFFRKSKDLLNENGILCFITSRYFMEAMYADKLRNFIKSNFSIVSISDYSGICVFKGVMVSPLVLILSCDTETAGNEFSVMKYSVDPSKSQRFKYEQSKLRDSGWVILDNKEEELFNRIESISNTYIGSICSIKQGIITGLDKAFIVTGEEIEKYNLESFLLKKWIKNSSISKSGISYGNLYLLYTNLIKNERSCPNTINYLLPFKDKLMSRRECVSGIRKWYELQWGRVREDFEAPKIMFPYKSCGNKFFYDTNEYFCSADIYLINDLDCAVSYEYLKDYLNSNIFEFYFKCRAKKVGINIFEYYPNKLNNMKIYLPDRKSKQNLSYLGKNSIDNFLERVFNINREEEKTIINKYVFKEGDDAK